MKNLILTGVVLCLCLCILGCNQDHLRGDVSKSPDGKTYLIVADDNGGCGQILVDGKPWQFRIGERGPISAGTHKIECSGEIGFIIPEGTVFKFNYWGP